jgi:hypothetical protein
MPGFCKPVVNPRWLVASYIKKQVSEVPVRFVSETLCPPCILKLSHVLFSFSSIYIFLRHIFSLYLCDLRDQRKPLISCYTYKLSYYYIPLFYPVFLCTTRITYVLSNHASREAFNAVSYELHTQIFNRKPSPLYITRAIQ